MPNSLAEVLPFALVFSTHLPVSVCGTGGMLYSKYSFSRPSVPVTSCHAARLHGISPLATSIHSEADSPKSDCTSPHTGTGILTRCPSPTLLSLGLGPTNPTRTDLPSETLDFRRIRFSLISRYSCQHSHSCTVQRTFRYAFTPYRTLPYHTYVSLSSVVCLSPVTLSAQLRLTSELLRTL